MDPEIVGSIINGLITAMATFFTGMLAVGIAIWQIRKTQKEVIRGSYIYMVSKEHELIMKMLDDPASVDLVCERFNLKNIPDDKKKVYIFILLIIDMYSLVFFRYKRGEFPNELWPQFRVSMSQSFKMTEFQEVWNSVFRNVLPHEFVQYKEAGFP